MDEPFELPVMYRGEELMFPAQLLLSGYVYMFVVDVYGAEVSFEFDEDREFRALVDPETIQNNKALTSELLQAIAKTLKEAIT